MRVAGRTTGAGVGQRPNTLDPVTLEILHNALRSITDETFIALMKSAYSTNIKERHDHSTAIMDTSGRLVVQAENSLPIHLASMTGRMESLLARFGLPVEVPRGLSADAVIEAARADKKSRGGEIRIAAPRRIGRMLPGGDSTIGLAERRLRRALAGLR